MAESAQQPVQASAVSAIDANKTIACVICHAIYTPARAHAYLLQASPIALESAFMSMCHFCFHCRRPACPECWDEVHGVCGICGEEAHLPFRVKAQPLPGTIFTPPQDTPAPWHKHSTSPALICIRPGTFQHAESPKADIDELMTRPQISAVPPTPVLVDRDLQNGALQDEDTRPRIKATPIEPASRKKTAHRQRVVTSDVSAIKTRPPTYERTVRTSYPERTSRDNVAAMKTRPDRQSTTSTERATRRHDIIAARTRPDITSKKKPRPTVQYHSPASYIGRILSITILTLLLIAALITTIALLFEPINTFIYTNLSIDIRQEIQHLLQYLQIPH